MCDYNKKRAKKLRKQIRKKQAELERLEQEKEEERGFLWIEDKETAEKIASALGKIDPTVTIFPLKDRLIWSDLE